MELRIVGASTDEHGGNLRTEHSVFQRVKDHRLPASGRYCLGNSLPMRAPKPRAEPKRGIQTWMRVYPKPPAPQKRGNVRSRKFNPYPSTWRQATTNLRVIEHTAVASDLAQSADNPAWTVWAM